LLASYLPRRLTTFTSTPSLALRKRIPPRPPQYEPGLNEEAPFMVRNPRLVLGAAEIFDLVRDRHGNWWETAMDVESWAPCDTVTTIGRTCKQSGRKASAAGLLLCARAWRFPGKWPSNWARWWK